MSPSRTVSRKASWSVAAVIALGSAVVTARRRGPGAGVLVGSAVVGTQLADYLLAAVRQEAEVRRARDNYETERLRALAAGGVDDTSHGPLNVIETTLDRASIPVMQRRNVDRVIAEVRRIAASVAGDEEGWAAHSQRKDGPLHLFGTDDAVK